MQHEEQFWREKFAATERISRGLGLCLLGSFQLVPGKAVMSLNVTGF